jgi:tetratricopeptide (TPR) repeat protein
MAFMLIFLLIPAMLTNSNYYRRGQEYYQQGKYDLAISEFREGIEPWYRRLDYNWSEDSSLMEMAKSYCQLENYDKAREIYLLIQKRRFDYYGGRAAESVKSLDGGLQKIKEYESLPADKKNDINVLYDLALAYRYDLNCRSKALEIYTKIASLPIDDRSKELAKKQIQELTAKENK